MCSFLPWAPNIEDSWGKRCWFQRKHYCWVLQGMFRHPVVSLGLCRKTFVLPTAWICSGSFSNFPSSLGRITASMDLYEKKSSGMKSFQNTSVTQSLASTTKSAVTDCQEKELGHPLASAWLSFPWHHSPEASGWFQGRLNYSLVTDWIHWNALT